MPRYWVCERCGGYNLRDECETCGLLKEEGQAYEVIKTGKTNSISAITIPNLDDDEEEDQEDTLLVGILDDDDMEMDMEDTDE